MNILKPGKYFSTSSTVLALLVIAYIFSGKGKHSLTRGSRMRTFLLDAALIQIEEEVFKVERDIQLAVDKQYEWPFVEVEFERHPCSKLTPVFF